MKSYILFSVLLLNVVFVSGQSIFSNPITGTNPNTSNPYTTGQTVDVNITVSGIGRGTGITGNAGNDRYNATSWNTGGIDMNDYFEFTLTPTLGCHIDFVSFVYTGQASGTGPTSFAFRSSLDGYVANIGIPNTGGTTISLAAAQYQNIGSAITFRFYGWGGSGGTFSINSFTFNGNTACPANTISTSNVTGGPFTVDCATTDLGTVDFTSTGTFNAGNIYTAQLSNSTGSFASPVSIGTLATTANLGTINITIPAGTATGAAYRIRVISSNPATIGTNNGVDISITNVVCPNTITTGAITGSPFSVTCASGSTGTIAFTSFGTFLGGNIYTAQLSNASGSFASPTSIGTFASTTNSGTINITIPAATITGAGYLIRIISTTPSVTGSSSASFTITLSGGPCVITGPYMTSVIINSCNPTCLEGNNEIVFGSTGDYSVLANATNIVLNYGNVPIPPTTYTDAFVTVPATTSAINASAGCTVVQEGLGATIPPNSNFVITRSTMCVDALDWSSLCGAGVLYILYSTDASWNTGGNFLNSPGGGLRYFRTVITATDASVNTVDYSYNSDLLLNSDGEFVTYNPSGGLPQQYGDDNCVLNPILLPVSLISFQGTYINSKSELSWQTASEQNNSHFTLSHSTDGYQFNNIGTVTGAGNSSELLDYRFIHNYPHPGMNYYKLKSTDYDGKEYFKGIVALEAEFNFSFYNSITSTIELSYESDIDIFTTDGKLIQQELNTSSIPFSKSGLFFIYDKKTGISERLFIP